MESLKFIFKIQTLNLYPNSVPAGPQKVIQKAIFNIIQSESCDEVEIAAWLVPLPNFIQNHQKSTE